MKTIITVEIEATRSKHFEKALNLMKSFPHFENKIRDQKEVHICKIKTIQEYINYYSKVEPLVLMVRKWSTASVILNNQELGPYLYEFRDFQSVMDGCVSKMVDYNYKTSSDSNVANDMISLDEDLTHPVTYYPPMYSPFFAFAKSVNKKPFFCSCQKESIINYLEMESEMLKSYTRESKGPFSRKFFPKIVKQFYITGNNDPNTAFEFKDNICHRCLGKTPKYNYCASMYGSKFKQKYGWYITEKYFDYGIVRYNLSNLNYLNEKCPEHIYQLLQFDTDDINVKNYIEREFENITREEFEVSLIGEKWVSETLMFKLLESMFSSCTVHRHHRPAWLQGLELDAYIPDKKLGFEYNGRQHYEAVDFFGGEERLEIQKENDRKKLKLCKEHGVKLIIIKYDEELNTDLIKKKVNIATP